MEFFKTSFTVAAIKSKYRELAKKFHPDLGGDEEVMKAVNNEYHDALKGKHKSTSTDKDSGKEYTYYYNKNVEQGIVDKLRELLGLDLPSNVIIELVGTWLWISGDTKPHKDVLGKNGAKLFWHSKRKMWYFRTKTSARKGRYNKDASFDSIKAAYGVQGNFQKDKQVA